MKIIDSGPHGIPLEELGQQQREAEEGDKSLQDVIDDGVSQSICSICGKDLPCEHYPVQSSKGGLQWYPESGWVCERCKGTPAIERRWFKHADSCPTQAKGGLVPPSGIVLTERDEAIWNAAAKDQRAHALKVVEEVKAAELMERTGGSGNEYIRACDDIIRRLKGEA